MNIPNTKLSYGILAFFIANPTKALEPPKRVKNNKNNDEIIKIVKATLLFIRLTKITFI